VHDQNSIIAGSRIGSAVQCPAGSTTLTCSDLFGNAVAMDGLHCGQNGVNGNISGTHTSAIPTPPDYHLYNTRRVRPAAALCGLIARWA